MNETVIERLARKLLKCPFDEQLFDSALSLRLHLCDEHRAQISRPHRVACQSAVENTERPTRLKCCLHCDFVVPDFPNQTPQIGMADHIGAGHHSNPFVPVQVSFRVSEDEELIDGYMERQGSIEGSACVYEGCTTICADDDSIALHWAEEHCQTASAEEARRALEIDAEKFRARVAEVFRELEEEEVRNRLAYREPDDGYDIHHSPNVPRVPSSPAEYIVYVERQAVHFPDRELEEMLEREGWDVEEVLPGEEWAEGRQQTTTVELRFCNIVDGYIPLVKDVRRILPPLMDGEDIEVSWQDEPGACFPCKVSRSKRAIYNLQGRIRAIFASFPSGVRLQITRVGLRRYVLGVQRQPHTVPNCKVFRSDGLGGWTVEIRDETVEWETGDQVFRHQLNFQQMEALHNEAWRAGLSVRDAVYQVMKRLAQSRPVHVRTVHDAVFLWIRSCSLAAVWAQFRPEHSCYVRVEPGWYRFDPAGRFPAIRIVTPRERLPQYSQDARRYRVKQRTWRHNIYESRLDDYRHNPDACLEVICAFGTPNEKVFVIPMPYLLEQVIPHADCNERGQYLFTVSPQDFAFTWDHGFRIEGKRFLADAD